MGSYEDPTSEHFDVRVIEGVLDALKYQDEHFRQAALRQIMHSASAWVEAGNLVDAANLLERAREFLNEGAEPKTF